MSFLSGLFPSAHPPAQPEASASSELFSSTSFSSSVSPAAPAASSSSSGSTHPSPATPEAAAPSALDTFSSFDPAKLHPLAGLGDSLDFLPLVDNKLNDIDGAASVLPSRGWTDDLCTGTGTTYLSGLALGGLWGFREGATRPLGVNPSLRLRINSILNGCTRRGSFLGNSLGVLAIFYNLTDSSLDAVRGKHDVLNSIVAGALSGAVFKSTAGVRPMLVASTIGTGFAASWSFLKTRV
ncbi:Mitochondrial import inner membrane translocase subunit tim23 [Cryptotrichosporon argae]